MKELPPKWGKVPLVDFVDLLPTGVKPYSGKRRYYSTGSINGGIFIPEGEYNYQSRPSRANRISKTGDVFQARMQGTDKALLIDENMPDQLFSTGFLQLRPIDGTYLNKLLYYYLKSDIFLKQRDEFATGSTQVALTDRKTSNIILIIPPLNEQRRIVAKLEKLLQRVDACKERLDKIPAILKRFRQSVLVAACSGRLTADWREDDIYEDDLPDRWTWMPVEELLPPGGIFDGPFGSNLKTSDYTDSGVRVIRLENVGHLRFISEKVSYISHEKYETLKKHTVGKGDIIFASFIDEEIRACLLPKLAVIAIAKADCFCLRPKTEFIDRQYLTYQLVDRESYNRLIEDVHGVTRPRINTTQLRKLLVRIPPLSEQQEIVRRVETLFKKADEIEARYQKAKAFVDNLSQSILAKAFRGELVSQDPDDEPVSVLLERIQKDRTKREAEMKTKEKTSCKSKNIHKKKAKSL